MKYPKAYSPDGQTQEVCIGDLIWWNEGVCVGFVEAILEEPADYKSWGLDTPSIAFTNLHPFESNKDKHRQHIGGITSGATVAYPISEMADEGVGLLSENELIELDWAIGEAKAAISDKHRHLPFCVSATINTERNTEDWQFHFVDREGQIIESVSFPFRPNTRS